MVDFIPFIFICGNSPFNHADPPCIASKHQCPNCQQRTLQKRRTDNYCKLCFVLPLFPVDEGEPYYQCLNPHCNTQLPLHPIGRPVTASNGPPIALSSPAAISSAPYSNRQPQQPVQPYQQPIGEYYRNVNDSSIYPGQQHAGYMYGNGPQPTSGARRPPTYGSGRVGGGGDDRPDGGPSGGHRGFRLDGDQPQKGTVVPLLSQGTAQTVDKGTTAQLPTVDSTQSKQPSAPHTNTQSNTMKQPSAP